MSHGGGGGPNIVQIVLIFLGIFIVLAAVGNFDGTKKFSPFGNPQTPPSPVISPTTPTTPAPGPAPAPSPSPSSSQSAACGISVTTPAPNEQVSSTVNISGYITGDCRWTAFEGQAGTVRVFDSRDNPLSSTEILHVSGDWMQLPAAFAARVTINTAPERTPVGYLLFTNEDASGDFPRTFVVPIRF